MSLVTGIDVSHWQTPSMQLANQRASFGDQFAIVKSTDGTGNDKAFRAHVANFHAAGLAVGTYCFYRSHKDPAAQARATAEQMAGQPLTFGAWLDYEGGSLPDTPDDLLTFLSVLDAATTQTIGIYTGGPFWESTIGNDRRFARYPLWLARYPNRFKDASTYPTTISVPAPAPWTDVALWQFSDGGGDLDRNVCTPETFAQITGNHPTPPPAPKETFMPKLTDDEQADLYAKVKELHADYAVSRASGTNGAKDNGSKRWQLGKIFNRVVLGKD